MIPTDDTLMAFVQWCRMNSWQITGDPVIVRRVFHAYTGLDLHADGTIAIDDYPSVTEEP